MTPDTIPALCHRGLCGLVHFYDVTEKYDASLIYHYGEDAYFLQCEAGETLVEAQKNWEEMIDSFLNRHHESAEGQES
jgi:hypothetical protein